MFAESSSIKDPVKLLAALEAARRATVGSEGPVTQRAHLQLVSSDMLLNAAANDDVATARCGWRLRQGAARSAQACVQGNA
jgi:hypothetical protein